MRLSGRSKTVVDRRWWRGAPFMWRPAPFARHRTSRSTQLHLWSRRKCWFMRPNLH